MVHESEKIQNDVCRTHNPLAQVAHVSQTEDIKSVLLQKVFLIITPFGVRDYYRSDYVIILLAVAQCKEPQDCCHENMCQIYRSWYCMRYTTPFAN